MANESIHTQFGIYLQAQPAIVESLPTDEEGNLAFYYIRGLPDSKADPYIVYKCSSYVEEQEIGGPPVVAEADMLVSCFSQNPDTAQTLASVVRGQLRFAALPFPMGPFTVLGTWIKESPDEPEQGTLADFGLFESVIHIGMQFILPQ